MMKVRSDFVTNSSSSSFIFRDSELKSKEESILQTICVMNQKVGYDWAILEKDAITFGLRTLRNAYGVRSLNDIVY